MATAIYTGFKRYKADFDKKQGKFSSSAAPGNKEEFIMEEETAIETIVEKEVKETASTVPSPSKIN